MFVVFVLHYFMLKCINDYPEYLFSPLLDLPSEKKKI
jgi:hypothetical protein